MKKLVCVFLSLLLVFLLWACGPETELALPDASTDTTTPTETDPPTEASESPTESAKPTESSEVPSEATEPTEPQPDPEATANLEYPELPETEDPETLLWAMAERHLTRLYYACYLYTEEDLGENTIQSLSEAQRAEITPYSSDNIDCYPEFVAERARYDAFRRSYDKIFRREFELTFRHNSIEFDGNWAIMRISAEMSFYYVDCEDRSFAADSIDVYFYCYEGTWLIYDVRIEFDFDYESPQTRTEFDADAAIAAYIALREGQE